jgi:hypothetical protein
VIVTVPGCQGCLALQWVGKLSGTAGFAFSTCVFKHLVEESGSDLLRGKRLPV